MTREEAIEFVKEAFIAWESEYRLPHEDWTETYKARDMAIEALTKPNYESDTEVRLAVTDRNKDKVVLWDAFGEVEYYPNGEINEPTQTHGRLIDADALSKKLCATTIFIKDGEVFQRMINDAPTVYADRPHGDWNAIKNDVRGIDVCGADMREGGIDK